MACDWLGGISLGACQSPTEEMGEEIGCVPPGAGKAFPRPQGITVCANLHTVPSLLQEMKRQDPDFPDVSSGVFVYEVIQGTAAAR